MCVLLNFIYHDCGCLAKTSTYHCGDAKAEDKEFSTDCPRYKTTEQVLRCGELTCHAHVGQVLRTGTPELDFGERSDSSVIMDEEGDQGEGAIDYDPFKELKEKLLAIKARCEDRKKGIPLVKEKMVGQKSKEGEKGRGAEKVKEGEKEKGKGGAGLGKGFEASKLSGMKAIRDRREQRKKELEQAKAKKDAVKAKGGEKSKSGAGVDEIEMDEFTYAKQAKEAKAKESDDGKAKECGKAEESGSGKATNPGLEEAFAMSSSSGSSSSGSDSDDMGYEGDTEAPAKKSTTEDPVKKLTLVAEGSLSPGEIAGSLSPRAFVASLGPRPSSIPGLRRVGGVEDIKSLSPTKKASPSAPPAPPNGDTSM
ncbi:uncharacterized protein PAC_05014 [Phialocephala subalpina]|uniref:Uncharacterized protein n=1 Tax=Phialocephala subalpina TaxID=576137 RepID=A0A1L7WQT0_9HELO|nr:uncharacterized protein PAC_05014 [Phialocephala subalpina]